ncbi:hypothetical protein AD934_00025, partial [Gluconobacter oxydans]
KKPGCFIFHHPQSTKGKWNHRADLNTRGFFEPSSFDSNIIGLNNLIFHFNITAIINLWIFRQTKKHFPILKVLRIKNHSATGNRDHVSHTCLYIINIIEIITLTDLKSADIITFRHG